MPLWCKNSAWRVYPNTRPGRDDLDVLTLHTGRNMLVSGQILLRSLTELEISGADIVGCSGISAEEIKLYRQEYRIYNDGVPYPDKLVPDIPCTVKAHYTQAMWLTVSPGADTPAGRASFDVVFHTSQGDCSAHVFVQIYDVALAEPADSFFDHEYFFSLGANKEYQPPAERFSPEWWELMKQYALAMKALRVNHLHVAYLSLLCGEGTYRAEDGSWVFNFERINAVIEHFLRWGSFKRIVLGATLGTIYGKELWGVNYPGQNSCFTPCSEEAEAYARALFTALRENFAEKGWLDMLLLHLNDEPHETAPWLWLRKIVAECMPGVPCSEPLDEYHSALELEGACNEFVPRLEVYEQGRDYFEKRQAAGDKVWVYSCCYPENPWYLNKFIDLPHHYSRLMKWACYACGITGFLHWGFNYWGPSLYGLNEDARFKGDGFIVYPDGGLGVLPSNRGMATREGIDEYELMKIAEKKYPQAVKALALSLTRSFSDFNPDPAALEAARIQLLMMAEKS